MSIVIQIRHAQRRKADLSNFRRFRMQEHTITLQEMELNHALPNLYFHLTTAYSILRAKGVPLGKKDYLGGFLGK